MSSQHRLAVPGPDVPVGCDGDVRVRPADREDVPTVLRLWNAARSPFATTTDDAAAVDRLLARDPGALLVAQVGDLVVGTAITAWDGWRGHIYRVAVRPDYRLRGIGRALVSSGHARLRALGATTVNVAVGRDGSDAIAFWLAVGYRRDAGMSRLAQDL